MGKPDETSIWKKEIAFRRKPRPVADEAPVEGEAEAVTGEAAPEPTSIWKKEITFRRKPKRAEDHPPAGVDPPPGPSWSEGCRGGSPSRCSIRSS